MDADWPGEVTEREAEVLAAVGARLSNAQIAHRLHISVRTVESHVSSLLRKLGVANRRELAAAAGRAAEPNPIAGLPASRTTFVGRERERVALLATLAETRLVSLLGPGGIGKTRLAAVVAEAAAPSYPSGGAFVDLVPVRDGFVTRAVAGALGVTERPPQPLEQALGEHLRGGRSLLVLDNCEHLVDEASALVERLLTACPAMTVLVTSRERLGVPGERTFAVPPLPVATDAERLFLDRARAVAPDVVADPAVVAELCARLDGMPLAIELAAARAGSLGVDGLRAALDDRLRLLTGGRGTDERHRSMRSVIGWSYDLLDAAERDLFRRLAVFVGGFDLDAAAATNPDPGRGGVADLIGRLVDKSLAGYRPGGDRSRWRLLETVRAFAVHELAASGEREAVQRLHLRWAAATAADLEGRLDGLWRAWFDEVADDLRAALAATPAEPDEVAHGLARSLAHLTFARGSFVEARAHYEVAAARAADGAAAADDLRSAADTAVAVAAGPDAFRLLVAAAERARGTGNGNALAAALASAVIAVHRYQAGVTLGLADGHTTVLLSEAAGAVRPDDIHTAALVAAARAWDGGRPDAPDLALARAAVAAAQLAGDPVLVAAAMDVLGSALVDAGQAREAHRIAEERLRLVEPMPRHEPYTAAEVIDAFWVASSCAITAGDLPAALALARRARTDDPIGGHPYLSAPKLIRALVLTGRFDETLDHADALWDRWRRAESPPMTWMASAISMTALVHGLRGDNEGFALWRSRALEIAKVDDPALSADLVASAAFVYARVAVHLGLLADAAELVARAHADFPLRWWEPYARAAGAELAIVAGLPDAGARLDAARPWAAENDWVAACLARAVARSTGDQAGFARAVDRWERIDARFERACTLSLIPTRAGEARAELHALGCPPPAAW